MKHRLITTLAAAAISMILMSSESSAQNGVNYSDSKYHSIAVGNLISGINSNNAGLSKSSIYFAGYYRVHEASSALIKILKDNTKDRWIRVYAALALYNMDETGAYTEIQRLANTEGDAKVKNICAAIYAEYLHSLQASAN